MSDGPSVSTVLVQLQTQDGTTTGPALDVPVDITTEQLELLTNELLKNVRPWACPLLSYLLPQMCSRGGWVTDR